MYIKKFNQFSVTDILESLNVLKDNLFNSIKAKRVDINSVFGTNTIFDSLKQVSENPDFLKNITKMGLRKSDIFNTADHETFLDTNIKFMFLYNSNDNDLATPKYMICEDTEIECFTINDNINNFYNKLGSKTIEIEDRDKKYIYKSTNKNEWILQGETSDGWEKIYRKDEFFNKIKNTKKIIVNIL